MLTKWEDYAVRKQINADLAREAARYRLVRSALGPDAVERTCCSALAWLGYRLVYWGKRLQQAAA